jgi:hypothetical protein
MAKLHEMVEMYKAKNEIKIQDSKLEQQEAKVKADKQKHADDAAKRAKQAKEGV